MEDIDKLSKERKIRNINSTRTSMIITIPKTVRESLLMGEGDRLNISDYDIGKFIKSHIIQNNIKSSISKNEGIIGEGETNENASVTHRKEDRRVFKSPSPHIHLK